MMLARAARGRRTTALSDSRVGGKQGAVLTIRNMQGLSRCTFIALALLVALLTGAAMQLRWFAPNL